VLLAALVLGASFTVTASGAGSAPAFVSISAGGLHTCAVTTRGGAKCWGSNINGTVGNGTRTAAVRRPVDVSGLTSGIRAISAGGQHTCALSGRGAVECWGNNTFGAVGSPKQVVFKVPFAVPSLRSGIKAIAAGHGFNNATCAITKAGAARCWGENGQSWLGVGSKESFVAKPSGVVGLKSGVSTLGGGDLFLWCAAVGGAAKCWGGNPSGALGNGATTPSPTPIVVTGLASGVTAVVVGANHACALVGAGVKCWGSGIDGQLGNGGRSSLTPVDVIGLTAGVKSIASGSNHVCAITGAGGVQCWGDNNFGQLGNGSTTDSSTPVDVVGLTSGVAAVSAGGQHTCALTRAGRALCWGGNQFGQLGTGSTKGSTKPVPVRT
jgi:alpha-tubulin suppressor-like RCC1 family protein